MSMTFEDALARWEELNKVLPDLKAEEMALRKRLVSGVFPEGSEGTTKQEMPDGRTLKAVHKIYRNVDTEAADKLDLSPAKKAKVFRKKYDLRISAFRAMDDDDKKKLSAVITERPGTPSLEIIEAKPKAEDFA